MTGETTKRDVFKRDVSKRLTRRALLRGAGGIAVALPLLGHDAVAAPADRPKRFVFCYSPNGVFTPQWFPAAGTSESNFTLNEIHSPLAAFREHCLWLSGVDMKVAVNGNGEQHQRGIGAVITGHRLDSGSFVGNDGTTAGWALGPSIDQMIATGQGTPVTGLQLGVNARERDVSGCVSYASAGSPLLPQNDPRVTFRNLFTSVNTPPDAMERLRQQRSSVLDAVLTQISTLNKSVGTTARARLDAHFTKIRELERRVTALPPGTCATPSEPAEVAFNTENAMPEVARLQIELMVLAFTCDLTRVATIMFSDAKNHISLPFLGVNSDVHNISHESDSSPTRAKLADRDRWVCQQFATIVDKMKATPDGDATLLDHSLLMLGSDVSRGNVHSHDDMPFVLAGHAAGWRMGRFVKYSGVSHNNLLVSILQGFGRSDTTVGDPMYCTGPLTGLT